MKSSIARTANATRSYVPCVAWLVTAATQRNAQRSVCGHGPLGLVARPHRGGRARDVLSSYPASKLTNKEAVMTYRQFSRSASRKSHGHLQLLLQLVTWLVRKPGSMFATDYCFVINFLNFILLKVGSSLIKALIDTSSSYSSISMSLVNRCVCISLLYRHGIVKRLFMANGKPINVTGTANCQ